jgi:acid phosphatase
MLLALVVVAGCATTQTAPEAETSQPDRETEGPAPRDNLNSTLWVQTSAEYRALARQTYATARRQLDQVLETKQTRASAALEQTGDTADKPPAVVLDVDETVLDNSAYQAKLVESRESFSIESWNAWCRRAEAEPIPGAVAFARYADRQGATVFYVTNREHEVEGATRENLKRHGFPLDDDRDVLLTKYEREGWEGSKVPRRKLVAEDFHIALLIGDSLGDFVSVPEDSSPEARRRLVDEHRKRWGRSWIVLPNPTYGDWEGALYDYDYGAETPEKRRRKIDALTVPDER